MTAKIDQWGIAPREVDPYQPPECAVMAVCGKVQGHPEFEDGGDILTSGIVEVWEIAEGKAGDRPVMVVYVKTRTGSVYELLEPSAAYESQFPNAKRRLVEAYKGKML